MDDATLMRQFSHDGFDVRIYLTRATENVFGGHVDIYSGDVHKCRIVLAGQLADDREAIVTLETKGRDWIAAWASRDHSGDTGFSQL